MPDWQKLVRRRLSGLAVDFTEREEIHTELAAHLEESYESLRTKGLPEQAAMQQTLAQVADWQDLRRRIQVARTRKENIMNDRVRQLWLPGLLTFVLSMGLLELVQKFGPRPFVLDLDKGTPVLMFYTSWLLTLPLAGAMGALLSKRAGGSPRILAISSVFPVLPFGVVFLIAIPAGLLIGHSLAHHIVAAAFLTMMFGWVLVPGVALLSGGLLVQLLSRRSSSPGVTMN
ncbi:MAG: hypothetical protein DMG44_10810 [Acidobacteria bacterium]|jgi:hypothetical protein|nr:MAG: hypothetical protein DMG44_10810 [Acidobacteriota bacterium]